MAAPTKIFAAAVGLIVAAPSGPAAAEGWGPLTEHQLAIAVYDQVGDGFQSQAGEIGEAGSEDAVIFQPVARFGIAQSEAIDHQVTIALDVISAASPDAIDAVSQASKYQEAFAVGVETTVARGADDQLSLRAAVAREEALLSIALGVGARRELADDNTTVALSIDGIFDGFDDYRRDGRTLDTGYAYRRTGSLNGSIGQVLSPTTMAWVTYGLTFQSGQLATPHNTAPIDFGGRYKENLPDRRWRHALGLRVAQRLPSLELTGRAGYRFYRDSFDITAHTGDVEIYRDIGEHVLARLSYRLHHQSAASFFADSHPRNMEVDQPRTSDSDLDRFWANEVGGKLAVGLGAFSERLASVTADASFVHYVRSNGLSINVATAGYTASF